MGLSLESPYCETLSTVSEPIMNQDELRKNFVTDVSCRHILSRIKLTFSYIASHLTAYGSYTKPSSDNSLNCSGVIASV